MGRGDFRGAAAVAAVMAVATVLVAAAGMRVGIGSRLARESITAGLVFRGGTETINGYDRHGRFGLEDGSKGIAAIAVTLTWAVIFPELRRARTFELAADPPPQDAVVAGGV